MSDAAIVWLSFAALIALVWWRATSRGGGDQTGGRRMGGIGSAAAGTIYDMLNEEKRNAIEVIVEERAGERDPEDRDGNLPDLAGPTTKN
jgi:hypothetical protein